MRKVFFFLVCLLLPVSIYAGPWLCKALDGTTVQYRAAPNKNRQQGINAAYFKCKRMSKNPTACRVTPGWCYQEVFYKLKPVPAKHKKANAKSPALSRPKLIMGPGPVVLIWTCKAKGKNYSSVDVQAMYRFEAVRDALKQCREASTDASSCRIKKCSHN